MIREVVPLWMGEQEILSDEDAMVEAGHAPRDTSGVSAWRSTCDVRVLSALDLYGSLLAGQTNGMSESLSLPAVEVAMRLYGVPAEDRLDVAGRLLSIHHRAVEVWKMKQGSKRG